MPNPTRRRRTNSRSRIDVAIVLVGLVAAAASSVAAWRMVGPYGDGALNVGLYRAEDPETGVQMVYRDVPNADGSVLRYLFRDSGRALMQIQVRRVVDGKLETVGLHMGAAGLTRLDAGGRKATWDAKQGTLKVGFSLRGNNVIDAWEYRNDKGELVKIEVSRRQDGKIDRWEYYENDQLARVDVDDDRDGKVDRRQIYEAGILVSETKVR